MQTGGCARSDSVALWLCWSQGLLVRRRGGFCRFQAMRSWECWVVTMMNGACGAEACDERGVSCVGDCGRREGVVPASQRQAGDVDGTLMLRASMPRAEGRGFHDDAFGAGASSMTRSGQHDEGVLVLDRRAI